MVRKFDTKYGAWLAGYYDDFTGARAVPSDFNIPSKTVPYDHTSSHYGNPLNGEATLNPRFRWSFADRDRSIGSNFFSIVGNKYLKNTAIADWLGYDKNRNDATKWGGKAQLQYPDGNSNTNKYEFNGSGSEAYQLFSNGYKTSNFYVVGAGDDDSTYGRKNMYEYSAYNTLNKVAGTPTSVSSATFLRKAHLTGTWVGEAADVSNSVNGQNYIKLFAPVKSPSGQPFLCIQTYRAATTSGANKPTIYYEGSLNSNLDGDVFSTRVAVRSFRGTNRTHGVGAIGADGTGKEVPTLQFRVGFAKPTSNLTNGRRINSDGFEGTPAITYNLDFYNNSLLDYDYYGEDSTTFSNDDAWIDMDFMIDYTAGTYRVFINGTEDTSATFNLAGSPTAANMYGWEMTLNARDFSSGETGGSAYSPTDYIQYLMLDRVGLLHHLSDSLKHDSNETPLNKLDLDFNSNGVSGGSISILDDPQYESATQTYGVQASSYYNKLTDVIRNSHDWQVLIFASETTKRRDRPIFKGLISNFRIKQIKNQREIKLDFNEPSAFLTTQIPLWEVGQKAVTDESSSTAYWLYDAAGFKELMNFGIRALKILDKNIGFDVDDNYADRSDSRMQLGSGHPIQMYNNEDEHGPNSLELEYEGCKIQGIYQKTVSSTDYTVINMAGNHGVASGQSVTIINTENYNGTYTLQSPTSGSEMYILASDMAYVSDTPKVLYAGEYMANTPNWHNTNRFLNEGEGSLQTGISNIFVKFFPHFNDPKNGYVNIIVDADPGLKAGDKISLNNSTYPNTMTVTSVSGPHWNIYETTLKSHGAGGTGYDDNHKLYTIHTDERATTDLGIYYYTKAFTGNSSVTYGSSHEITNASINLTNTGVRKGHLLSGANIDGTQFITQVTSSVVDFDGDATAAGTGGTYAVQGDALLRGSDRLVYAKQADLNGVVLHSSFETRFQNKVLHAKWMRDLSKSLWFQFQFGIIGRNARGSSSVLANLTPASNDIKISSELYSNIDTSYGIGEIIEGDKISRFIYRGKQSANTTGDVPDFYLTGVKFINQNFTTAATVNIARTEESYKHIWLLWADMRNDGTADADGGTRKTKFGLKYPTADNYNLSMFFTDSFDEKGEIKKFTDLKIGEDISLWDVDATNDPTTGIAFSKPVDYANAKSVQVGLGTETTANDGGLLKITKPNHGYLAGEYLYVWDLVAAGTDYSGYYAIHTVTTNTIKLKLSFEVGMTGISRGAASATTFPTFWMAKATGSAASSLTKYQDWENKGGAFAVVDASRFFNLNTGSNEGRTGQDAGGQTTLEEYVATIRGYPALIDNYYSNAIATGKNLAALYGEHQNAKKMLFDSTTVTGDVGLFHTAIRVKDTGDFGDTGTGRISLMRNVGGTRTDDSITYYYLYREKLATEINGHITGLGLSGNSLTLTDTNQSAFANIKPGMMIESLNSGKLYRVTGVDAASDEVVVYQYDLDEDVPYTDDDWAVGFAYRLEPQLANLFMASPSEVYLATDIAQRISNYGESTGEITILAAPSTSASTTNITGQNGATLNITSYSDEPNIFDDGTSPQPNTKTYIFRNDAESFPDTTLFGAFDGHENMEDANSTDVTMTVNAHGFGTVGHIWIYREETVTYELLKYTSRTELGNGKTTLTMDNPSDDYFAGRNYGDGARVVESRLDRTHTGGTSDISNGTGGFVRVRGTGTKQQIAADLEIAINSLDGNNAGTANSRIFVDRTDQRLVLAQTALGSGGNREIHLERYGNQAASFIIVRGMSGGHDVDNLIQVPNMSDIPAELDRMYGLASASTQPYMIPISVTEQAVTISNSISAEYGLRMMMHIEGDVETENTGTYYNSDKFRTLWTAATMNTWLPPTNINVPMDINNIPITENMAYQNDTNRDSWGGAVDSRGKSLGNIIKLTLNSIGFSDGERYIPFSKVVGRDGRMDFRPRFNSGISLDRTNVTKSEVSGGVVSKISNVRVYYDQSKSFVDYPSTNFTDTTKWKVLHEGEITSSIEARSIAEKEYSKLKESPLRIKTTPIREGNVDKIMMDSGRYGYISDPYRALQSNDAGSNASKYWTRVGTGGCLFPGQVNALDGNIGDASGDIKFRVGRSQPYHTFSTGSDTGTAIPYDENYYWYGSNSLAYAMQIVHVPNHTPITSTTTGNELRVFIALKNGQSGNGASVIQNDAIFTVYVVDYVFGADKTVTSVAGVTSKNIKGSGFYEIEIPTSYGAVADAKIVFSANGEYLRGLLRHRCNFTENDVAILKNAHVLEDGSSTTALSSITTGNAKSIFPLGGREYTTMSPNMGCFKSRTSWYAPRINVTRDLSYWPSTFVKYTDQGLDLNNETLTIQNIRYTFTGRQEEQVRLTLERDETLLGDNILSYLFPSKQPDPTAQLEGGLTLPPSSPVDTGSGAGAQTIDTNEWDNQNPGPQGIDNGRAWDNTGDNYGTRQVGGMNQLSAEAYRTIRGFANMTQDMMGSRGQFRILGQDRPAKTSASVRRVDSDIELHPTMGSGTKGAEGYILPGSSLPGGETGYISKTAFETEITVPRDIISDQMEISATLSHGVNSQINPTNGVLTAEVENTRTGTKLTSKTNVALNTNRQTMYILPTQRMTHMQKGDVLKIRIIRDPNDSLDTSSYSSIIVHSLSVGMHRANSASTSTTEQLTPYE